MAVSKRLRYEVLRRDGHTCRYCGRAAPEVRLTVDHVVPVTLGGSDLPENLVTACSECNSGKSATPVDAATVNDVKQDALRWSSAVRQVAQSMLADLERRNQLCEEFRATWDRWLVDQKPIPLPPGWRDSINNFLAAGLPMPLLADCAEIAISRHQVAPRDRFRYMCGIAWKRVTELQNAALDRVAAPPNTTTVSSGNGDEVVGVIFGALPWCDKPEEWPSLMAEFDLRHEDDENEAGEPVSFAHWSDYEKVFAASVERIVEEHMQYRHWIGLALSDMAPKTADRLLDEAQRRMELAGESLGEWFIAGYAAYLGLREHPDAERS